MTAPAPHLTGGVLPALVTPLTAEGQLDREGLGRLVEKQIEAGVSGLFALGTTGEASYLTREERVAVVGTVVDVVAGRLPVLAGAIELSSGRVIEEARALTSAGAQYIVATSPIYGAATDDEVIRHFCEIAEGIDVPVFVYDIPFKTNRKLTPAITCELARRRVIAGLKDSGGDFRHFREFVLARPDGSILALNGTEQMLDASLLVGGSGGILGLANIAPSTFVKIYEAALGGQWLQAGELQAKIVSLCKVMEVGMKYGTSLDTSIFASLKHVLAKRGVIESPRIKSGSVLPTAAVAEIDQLVETLGLS